MTLGADEMPAKLGRHSYAMKRELRMRTLAVVLALFGGCAAHVARAADSCQICRDYHQACVKAHSQAACKSEYDICMRHCKQK